MRISISITTMQAPRKFGLMKQALLACFIRPNIELAILIATPDETDNRADRHTCYHLGILRYRGYNESHLCGFYKSHCPDGARDRDGSGCKSHHPIRRTTLIVSVSKCRHASRSVESALFTPPWILDGNFPVFLINEKLLKTASSVIGNLPSWKRRSKNGQTG